MKLDGCQDARSSIYCKVAKLTQDDVPVDSGWRREMKMCASAAMAMHDKKSLPVLMCIYIYIHMHLHSVSVYIYIHMHMQK